ncbi:hypothetical protein BC834DRAFT_898689, partial [Gloeopeniophorella convolvens]
MPRTTIPLLHPHPMPPHHHLMKVLPTHTVHRAPSPQPPRFPLYRLRANPLQHLRLAPPHQIPVHPWQMRQLRPMCHMVPRSHPIPPHPSRHPQSCYVPALRSLQFGWWYS